MLPGTCYEPVQIRIGIPIPIGSMGICSVSCAAPVVVAASLAVVVRFLAPLGIASLIATVRLSVPAVVADVLALAAPSFASTMDLYR